MIPPPDPLKQVDQLAAHLFRHSAGKMTAVLTRRFGLQHLDLVLDAVQDSFEMALTKWRYGTIPNNPEAWLMTVARHQLINRLKKVFISDELPDSAIQGINEDMLIISEQEIADSQLQLLLTCCHPSFSVKNQLSITLYVLCGFGVPEIANALMSNREAIKKALSRCKSRIQELPLPLQPRTNEDLKQNIHTIHTVLYLMFNEGYKTTRDHTGINRDLCFEALRLAKLLLQHPVGLNQTHALLALLCFNLARFPARITDSGEWLTLDKQDRSLWIQPLIREGFFHLQQATDTREISKFHIEAIIASIHCSTPEFSLTPWSKIIHLYSQLAIIEPPSPHVELNKLIAQGYADIRALDFTLLDNLEHLFHRDNRFVYYAAAAHLYRHAGDTPTAINHYLSALQAASAEMDKQFVRTQLADLQ